jgi:ABC-type uncharacterized transport system substrate-binding protein
MLSPEPEADMKRREFLGVLGGATAGWPLTARAQQSERMRRIGVLSGGSAGDPEVRARTATFTQELAQLGWTDGRKVIPINVRNASEVERAVAAFARTGNGGLIVTAGPLMAVHRNLIVALAARHKLPAIYGTRFYVTDGGLVSYGADFVDQYRRAAGYVDRILKGEKPADLPVQAPTKYELAINLKTAKALDLTVPPTVLARADEVIE